MYRYVESMHDGLAAGGALLRRQPASASQPGSARAARCLSQHVGRKAELCVTLLGKWRVKAHQVLWRREFQQHSPVRAASPPEHACRAWQLLGAGAARPVGTLAWTRPKSNCADPPPWLWDLGCSLAILQAVTTSKAYQDVSYLPLWCGLHRADEPAPSQVHRVLLLRLLAGPAVVSRTWWAHPSRPAVPPSLLR